MVRSIENKLINRELVALIIVAAQLTLFPAYSSLYYFILDVCEQRSII